MATLHRVDGSFEIPAELPVIALRDIVFFPYMVLPLLIGRRPSVAALDEATAGDRLALLAAQRDPGVDRPGEEDLYRVGTVVRVVQVTQLKGGTARVVLEGLGRARIERFVPGEGPLKAEVELVTPREHDPAGGPDSALDALARGVEDLFREYVQLSEKIPDELIATAAEASDRVRLAHLIAGHLLIASSEKQEILEAGEIAARYEMLLALLIREVDVLRIQNKLDEQIRLEMETGRSPRPLEEQLESLSSGNGSPRSRMGRTRSHDRRGDASGRGAQGGSRRNSPASGSSVRWRPNLPSSVPTSTGSSRCRGSGRRRTASMPTGPRRCWTPNTTASKRSRTVYSTTLPFCRWWGSSRDRSCASSALPASARPRWEGASRVACSGSLSG